MDLVITITALSFILVLSKARANRCIPAPARARDWQAHRRRR